MAKALDSTPPAAVGGVETPTEPWQPRQIAALTVVALCGVLVALTQTLLIPVFSEIQIDLGSSTSSTQWLLTSTLLVGAVTVPVFGRLADLYGKRRLLIAAATALAVGSLICALSNTLPLMVVGRAITGMSAAAIPLGISLIGAILPAKRAAGGIALVSATLGIGGALGLPLAALVAQHFDYHALFWISLAGAVVVIAGIVVAVVEPPLQAKGRMDYVGAVLLAAALVCLLLPLSQATSWGWGDAKTIGLLAAAAVLFIVFALVELRVKSPLVDLVVNARPGLLLTNVASVCVGFALFASLIGTASYVQAPESTGYGFGASILVSGLVMLPSGLAMLALSPISAMLTIRFGPKVTLALGASIVALGFVSRIIFIGNIWEIVIGSTIAGAGTGIAYAAMPSLILRSAPPAELAAANGLNALARTVGSSLSSAIGGTLLAASTVMVGAYALPSLGAYRVLFLICAVAALAGAAIALMIPTGSPAAAPRASSPKPAAA